jgi:squalene-hopene/tetraprenyl-beta-curcumene cyclase
MRAPWVRRCIDWMLSKQNDDGGWGESIESYSKPATAGEGPSDAVITAGVVSALMDAGEQGDAVRRGIEFVLSRQDDDGLWDETQCYYVILPPDFYYTNYYYSQYLALDALVKYRTVAR